MSKFHIPAPALDGGSIRLWLLTLSEHPEFLGQLTPFRESREEYANLEYNLKSIFNEYQYSTDQKTRNEMLSGFIDTLHQLSRVQTQELDNIDEIKGPLKAIYSDLLNHMIMEQDMFERILLRETTIPEEVAFIKREAAQHTKLLGQIREPSDQDAKVAKTNANNVSQSLLQSPTFDKKTVYDLKRSEVVGEEALDSVLQGKFDSNFVSSELAERMIIHEDRETRLAAARILRFRLGSADDRELLYKSLSKLNE